MRNIWMIASFVVLLTIVLSCGIADRFTGGDQAMARATALWPDVPRADDLNVSEMEMPFAIKVLMRTALNNLWRLNNKDEDRTPAAGDWIAFTTPKTPAELANFYNNDRMTSFGSWEAGQKSTCLDGKENGIDGVICVFQKIANGKDIKLAIIAMKDEGTKQTNVFFIRIEEDAKPGAANSSNTAPPPTKSTRGPITALSGAAPYGIESRPMPTGTNLETLLPKRVGPFERVTLEKSEARGTTADRIEVGGSSVYATYRDGDREIFVELGVNAKPEDAQDSLDVAAGDAAGGKPTDPKVGSIATEPSYLKSGAFMAWTRGRYFFSADAKGGEADLDAFMRAFPF